ncbi:MAG: hypothetical protein BWY66_00361 [bacterium ADurb.Bin374]|nr:MAG: hypothetical protein BWY66_00361 [bacterium ADurb.Bin374]
MVAGRIVIGDTLHDVVAGLVLPAGTVVPHDEGVVFRRILDDHVLNELGEKLVIAHVEFAHVFDGGDFALLDVVESGGAFLAIDEADDVEPVVRADLGHFVLVLDAEAVQIVVSVQEDHPGPFLLGAGRCTDRGNTKSHKKGDGQDTDYTLHLLLLTNILMRTLILRAGFFNYRSRKVPCQGLDTTREKQMQSQFQGKLQKTVHFYCLFLAKNAYLQPHDIESFR